MSIDVKKLVAFQTERNAVNLYRKFFTIIEDLEVSHTAMLESIAQMVPEDQLVNLKMADYLTPNYYQYLRKKILDAGNEMIRESGRLMDQLDVKLKETS